MGAWWAGVYGVAQSRAQLNWLSSSSRSSLLLKTSLFAGSRGYSVIAVYWLFNPVLLLMYITGTRALRLSCSPPAYLPGAFAIFPNQVLSTGSKGKTLWKEFETFTCFCFLLLHEAWHHGLFMRLRKDCPCFKPPPEIRTDWGSPPKGSYRILKLSCHVGLFLLQFLNPTLEHSSQRAGLSLDSLVIIRQ